MKKKSYNDIMKQRNRVHKLNKTRRDDQKNRVDVIVQAKINSMIARKISRFINPSLRDIKK